MPFEVMNLRLGEDIGNNHPRLAAAADQIGEFASDAVAGDRRVGDRRQAVARHIIYDVQHAETTPTWWL